jgi:hypothetical protein
MLPYLTTFNLSFIWMITYWTIIFFAEEIAHLIFAVCRKENAYLQRMATYQSRIHMCWLISLAFAFFYSLEGATTFMVWCIPLMVLFFTISLGFKWLRTKLIKRSYLKQVRKTGFAVIE